MAYSAPSVQVTGDLITAAIWNVLVNDILLSAPALMTAAGDVLVASAANTPARVALGNAGAFFRTLTSGGASAGWSTTWKESTGGHLFAQTDDTYTIGASGANRPQYVYASRALVGPSSTGAAYFTVDVVPHPNTTVTSGATLQPFGAANNFAGLMGIAEEGGVSALFWVGGGVVTEIGGDNLALYTTTSGNAGTTNVYQASGTGIVTLQNNRGFSRNYRVSVMRLATGS